MKNSIALRTTLAACLAGLASLPCAHAGAPQSGNPLSAPVVDAVEGTFAGDGVVLVLARQGEGYAGTLEFKGTEYPCRASATAGSVSGSFRVGTQDFPFTGSLDGARLTLESGGATYSLTRVEPEPEPEVEPEPAVEPAPQPGGSLSALADLGATQADPTREWTILVYLDGDNNLESFALSDLNELEKGLPSKGVEVIVLCDRAEGFSDADGDWTDARLFRIRRDDDMNRVVSPILAQPGELNMGAPETLEAFVGGALRAFPAPRTALVLWNHGGGWSVLASDDSAPGVESGHDALSLPQCANAVRGGLAAAGVQRLDLIGFDMCLMGQLETAVEVADLAKVLVASQAIEPGDGWPYTEILDQFEKGTLGTTRIAGEIVNAYAEFYAQRGDLLSTQSALDLTQVDGVLEALDAMLEAVDPSAEAVWPSLSRALFFAESYADMTDIRGGVHALASVDLLDAMKRIRNNLPGFSAEREYRALVEAMDRLVLGSRTSPLRFRSNGVAAYAPVRGSMMNAAYAETRLAERTGWDEWLSRLHVAQANGSEAPTIGDFRLLDNDTGKARPSVTPLGGVSVHFSLTGNNILWTQALSGIWDEDRSGAIVFNKWLVVDPEYFVKVLKGEKEVGSDQLQLTTPVYANGRNELQHELQGIRYAVSNGEDAFYGTIDRSDVSDQDHLRVPIVFDHPSVGRYGGTLYFDAQTWEAVAVVLEIVQPDGSLTFQQLSEVPADAQITTLFEFVVQDGSVEYVEGGSMNWRDGLELVLGSDDPGSYVVAFTAETVAGDSATEFFRYEVTQSREEAALFADGGKFTADQWLGTWAWVGTPRGQDKPVPMGLTTVIRAHPENPGMLVGETTSTDAPDFKEIALIVPDTRMLPNARFLRVDEAGQISGYQLFTALYGEKNGVAFFTMKDAATGRLYGLVRQDAGEQNAPAVEAAAPAEDDLAGIWQDSDGLLFAFDGKNWEMGAQGQLLDTGTYSRNGDTIALTSASSGETFRFTIKIRGKRMTATDEYGERTRLTKIQ